MKRKLITITVSLILLFVFASPALAQGPGGAQVIFGDNLTIEGEQTLERDVVVFGGNVTVDQTSKIKGDLAVFGGNAKIDGTVEGDIAMIGGNVTLGETAVIEGDIGLVGGQADIADGAELHGDLNKLNKLDLDYGSYGPWGNNNDSPNVVPPSPPSPSGPFHWIGRIIGDIFWTISLLVVLSLITWLVASFMPEQMMTVRETITGSAPVSFGFGLLTSVIIAVSFLLVITICLAFVPLLASLVAGIAILFGWIVIGQIIGERLLTYNGHAQPNFVFSSIIGVAILTLVINMPVIGQIPCLGFLFSLIGAIAGFVVSMTGLGAVLLTRFGTRPYPGNPYPRPGRPSSSPGRRAAYPADPNLDDELGVAAASEEELKARIRQALAEADEAGEEPSAPDEPLQDDEPEPDQPTPEEPDDDQGPADDDPDDPDPDRLSPKN